MRPSPPHPHPPDRRLPPQRRSELPTSAELLLLAEEVCLAVGWFDEQLAVEGPRVR